MKSTAHIAGALLLVPSVLAQGSTWCGKNFKPNQTVVPPGGQFQLPVPSDEPLVAFRCSPVFRPYLEEDAKDAAFVVDAPIVYQHIQGASLISLSRSGLGSSECDGLGTLDVTISIGDRIFARQEVPLNTTGHEIPVDISRLSAQKTGHNVTCDATYRTETWSSAPQYYSANTSLLYLPDTRASVVKTDLRTGVLWARPANGTGGNFRPFVPQGFYVSFDQRLAKNLSYIDQLKADGFNTVHPIPPYDDATLFEQVLNRTVELGLYLIYDMRSSYQNLTAVAQQVEMYSSLPNLLLWETAHEPDGNSDPFDAARSTYDLIYERDGYHPVSIVLNCQDYDFAPYVRGADVVLEDAYPVGINATFSPVWHTECTSDFGHCGCDDCQGDIADVTTRVQTFKDRLRVLGQDRTKTVWTTPQAIGSGAYWRTTPTGREWAAMGVTSLVHGATGSMSFQWPTTSADDEALAFVGVVAETIEAWLVDPRATREMFDVGGVDVGLWRDGSGQAGLLLVANLGTTEASVAWDDVGLGRATVSEAFSAGQVVTTAMGLNLGPGAVGIYTCHE